MERHSNAFGQDTDIRKRKTDIDILLRHRSYEKFFSGFTEYSVLDEKGRTHVRRVYTGRLYRELLSPEKRRMHKLVLFLAFLLSAGLLTAAMVVNAFSNHQGVPALMVIPAYVLLACLLAALLAYVPAGGMLKIHEYRDGAERIPTVARWGGIAVIAELLISAVLSVINRMIDTEIIKILLLVAAAVTLFAMAGQQQKINYEVEQSAVPVPVGGIEIRAE